MGFVFLQTGLCQSQEIKHTKKRKEGNICLKNLLILTDFKFILISLICVGYNFKIIKNSITFQLNFQFFTSLSIVLSSFARLFHFVVGLYSVLGTVTFSTTLSPHDTQSGHAKEFHPRVPTEPYVKVSLHTALHIK